MKYLKIKTDARVLIIIATMFFVSRRVIVCRSKNTTGIQWVQWYITYSKSIVTVMACMRRWTIRTHHWRMHCQPKQRPIKAYRAFERPNDRSFVRFHEKAAIDYSHSRVGQEPWFIIDPDSSRCFCVHAPSRRLCSIVRRASIRYIMVQWC